MLSESLLGNRGSSAALLDAGIPRVIAGVVLYEVNVKLAGSLYLMVSFPTMIVGIARYSRSDAFDVLRREQPLFRWMAAGSILGAGLGGLLLGMIPTRLLLAALGCILLISGEKTFRHID